MGDHVVPLGWFVCPTVSIVTTGKPTGLEKTLLQNWNMFGQASGQFPTLAQDYGHTAAPVLVFISEKISVYLKPVLWVSGP